MIDIRWVYVIEFPISIIIGEMLNTYRNYRKGELDLMKDLFVELWSVGNNV